MLNKMIIKTGKREKGYLYHNILNKMVLKRVIFKVCHSKRGIIFQIRDHSIRVFYRCAGCTCMLIQEIAECHPPPLRPPPHTHILSVFAVLSYVITDDYVSFFQMSWLILYAKETPTSSHSIFIFLIYVPCKFLPILTGNLYIISLNRVASNL